MDGPAWIKELGLFQTATCIILSNNAPVMVKAVARVAKVALGNRIQICDGVDDDVEIQAALDAVPVTGGKVVALEGGYSIGDTVTVSIDYTTFELLGTIQNNGTTVLLTIAASHVKLKHGVYDANNVVNRAAIGVNTAGSEEDILIRDVEIKNSDLDGIIFGQNTTHLTIENNYIHDCRQGISGSGVIAGGCSHVEIKNNRLETVGLSAGYHGIYINYTDHLRIHGNNVSGVTDGYGIRAADETNYCEITGNTLVDVSSAPSPIIASEGSKHVIIGYNKVYNCGGAYGILSSSSPFTIIGNEIGTLTKAGAYGINVTNQDNGQIIGNSIGADGTDITGRGIYLYAIAAHSRVAIVGNIIGNIKGNAIEVDADYSRCQLIGNRIAGAYNIYTAIHIDGSYNLIMGNIAHNGDYNLELSASSNNNRVVDNDFRVAGTAPILDAGTNNHLYEKYCESFMDIQAVTANYVGSWAGTGAEQVINPGDAGWSAQPDIKRNLTVTCTAVGAPSGDIVIAGVNAKGQTISEAITVNPGGIRIGNEAFATITTITIPATIPATDTIDVGIGSKLGLANIIYATADVYKVTRTTGGAPGASAADYSVQGTDITVNITYHTVDMAIGAGIVAGDCYAINYKVNLNVIA